MSQMVAESCREYFNKQIEVCALELRKHGGPFLCGRDFTSADILLTHCLNWAGSLDWPLPSAATFRAYLQRTTTRPAYVRTYGQPKGAAKL